MLFIPVVLAKQGDTTTTTLPINNEDVKRKTKEIYEKVKNSDIQASFFGTEYTSGDSATVWLQLLRNYLPIDDATCYISAYNPDKTIMLNRTLMTYLGDSDGLYYYDLTAPSTSGVYMLSAMCVVPSGAFSDEFIDYSKLESYSNITLSGGKVSLAYDAGAENAVDSSGNGRDGTLANMESSDWVSGKLNEALLFDGVNEYVDLEDIASFDKEQSFSVESWVKTTSTKTQNIVSKRDVQPNIERGWEFSMKNGSLKFTVSRSITNTYWVSQESIQKINDGNWHHVVAVWEGVVGSWGYPSNIKLYIDGALADSYPSGNVVGWSILTSAHCQISGKVFDTYNVFDGRIDEVVIYNKTLNSTEIIFRYNAGAGTENMIAGVSPYGWWHLNPVMGATTGYIKSIPVNLTGNFWKTYDSDYELEQGGVVFKILDQSDNMICSSLGDISSCAGSTTPIKLYAELSRPYVQNATPEIDRWWAVWETESHEEIRGAGELHISANACADISEKITSVNDTVKAESQQIQTNQQETYNWLQDFNATMNDRFVTVLSAIGNLTFNDTAIMDKLTSIENSLTNLENNMASLINTAKADILSLMNSYYSNILSAILALPDSITMQISTQAPDWISCAAQKITGVYPAGSTCR